MSIHVCGNKIQMFWRVCWNISISKPDVFKHIHMFEKKKKTQQKQKVPSSMPLRKIKHYKVPSKCAPPVDKTWDGALFSP